jgi:hypothetical protein
MRLLILKPSAEPLDHNVPEFLFLPLKRVSGIDIESGNILVPGIEGYLR